jgi:hypothetical protein
MRALWGGCLAPMTREHFISEKAIRALFHPSSNETATVTIGGTLWLPPGEVKDVGIPGLGTRVLCHKHNSDLSPLDDEGGELVLALRAAWLREQVTVHLDGALLERWFLKTMCGALAGRAFKDFSGRILDEGDIKPGWLEMAYGLRPLPALGGIYCTRSHAPVVFERPTMSVSLANLAGRAGQACIMNIYDFEFAFSAAMAPTDALSQVGTYRPREISVRNAESNAETRIEIEWPSNANSSGDALRYESRLP